MGGIGNITQAVVLAGGRGTRLGALTLQTPKPMLAVAGRPFMEYLLTQLRYNGITHVVLSVGYLAEMFQKHFGTGRRLGLKIEYVVETTPAGTGGPLKMAAAILHDQFFVVNGDTIFDVPLGSLAAPLALYPDALGVVALRWREDASRYGKVDRVDDWITKFQEKSESGAGWISGGIYCFRKSALQYLPEPPCSIEREFFPLLANEHRLIGTTFEGYFIDIGLPETLMQAGVELPAWVSKFAVKSRIQP